MKAILLGALMLFALTSKAQDTVQPATHPYVRLMPIGVYTNPGVTADRITQNIEVGESFKMLDAGLAIGRLSLRPDSTAFVEGKITMDACQYGIFSNEVLVGAGYNFNSSTPLLLEIGSSIFAQIYSNYGVGISVSSYSLSGAVNGTNNTFFGLFLRWGLPRTDSGNLLLHKAHGHHGR